MRLPTRTPQVHPSRKKNYRSASSVFRDVPIVRTVHKVDIHGATAADDEHSGAITKKIFVSFCPCILTLLLMYYQIEYTYLPRRSYLFPEKYKTLLHDRISHVFL